MKSFAVAACLCFSLPTPVAQQPAAAAPPAAAPTPTASMATGKPHKVLFAVTSGDEADWNFTFGNIRNLLKALAPDPVQIEVVAYGPGIVMLKADSSVAKDIADAQKLGVQFMACQNAMRARHLELKDLVPDANPVPAGIGEVVTRQEQGWIYIKAGK